MKKLLFIAFATCIVTASQAQVKMPAPSTSQSVKQAFGLGEVEITYARPNKSGRTIFGDLVPYGKLWRTGANAATVVKFTDDVIIGGKTLPAGSYALYTIPNKSEWEIIFNKGFKNSGIVGYDQADDVVRMKVPAKKSAVSTETFTIEVADVKNETCNIQINWENTVVNIPVKTEVKERLRTQIEAALKSDKKPYREAATFYTEWDKDLTKATGYINSAIEQAEAAGQKAFWLYMQQARIYKQAGNKSAAKAAAQKCVQVATEANNQDYIKMGNELIGSL